MSIVFSKNKEKRSRSSSSEANNSFVKNVTSRVSGLLPAAVTKWFSSPSSSTANGSAPSADATDSSTEDEGPELATQPPSKRMRYTSPGNFNHYSPQEPNCISNETNEFGTVQSPPGRATFRRETNFVSTPLRPTDDTVADLTEKDTFKTQHSISAVGASVAAKRKSLFDSPNRADTSVRACTKTSSNTVKDPSQPCFKPSLLGSPFYPGRTMYGGASASYVNHPNIKLRRNALVNETSTSDNTVSHSTQRIMDLLEHYSSPLNEARRIPQYTRTPRSNSLSSSLSSTSPPSTKLVSYKTQELHVPNIASILRLKQRSRLMDTTTAARQIIASHSSTVDHVPYPVINTGTHREREQTTEKEPSNKLTTKVKSRLTRPKRGESIDLETEMPAPVNLPTATLQIDQQNLPKFTFGTPAASKPSPAFTNSTPIPTKNTDTSRKPDVVTSANPFQFSSPVRLPADQQPNTEAPKFTFGSPERGVDKTKHKDDVPCVIGTHEEKNVAKEKDWQCADCWVNNKPDKEQCVCCGGKKPSTHTKPPAKCTLCKLADTQPLKDKCVNCEKIKINNVIKPLTKPDDSSKWKCEDCWVSNDSGAEACVCCGANNPNTTKASKPNAIANDKADGEWKCDDCWIKNKSDVDKCVACGGSKPGAKGSTTPAPTGGFFTAPLPKPPDNTFKAIAKAQTDKWECPSCLVRNDGNKDRCVCCETEREGTTSEAAKKSFNFGVKPNTTFKFGIDLKAQVAPAAKPAEAINTTESKKEESETNNNVLSKTPSFTFGLPAKKPEDQTDSAKKEEVKTDAPKINFSFGIPKTAAATAAVPATPAFTAPKPAEKPPAEDKEKPQEVPKVASFTVPIVKTTPKPVGNIFSPPMPASQASPEKTMATPIVPEKPIAAPLILNSTISVEKKVDNPLLPQPAATTAAAAPQVTATATFSFGSGGLKLSSNLFTAPTTTAATSGITFGSPLQSAPATVPSMFQTENKASPVASPFGKTDATVPLFQKPEAPTPAAPMFSFGSSMSQPQPAAEKPKFNFTFGSTNKTETPSLFKPPENKLAFGAPMENKFALPGTNSIANNAMNSNGLPVGNITSPGNGLPNALSTATNMVHNPLASGNGLGQSGIFGSPVQKDNNMWPTTNNSANMFTSGNTTLQKPGGFSFGATSTPFNATSTPAFGASQPNVFGMSQTSNQPSSMFAAPSQPSVFGSPQPSAPAPAMGMFGSPGGGAPPAFGSPSQAAPTFDAPSLTPAPAPAFNFGGQQQATGIFGFGQQPQPQQQQPQPQPGGVYAFGASPGGAPVQFSMGSAHNTAAVAQGRRMRKAVRRTPQR
ncbi:hypothetical protein O0L34_g2224 [Tuta absoluta]|nr:hypothetical protein O0L34_g2224 [Tuta absoluta]